MNRRFIAILFALAAVLPTAVAAQGQSLSVTVTPPLFQLTIGPGQSWTSSLKIVNSNSYDVTYYAQSMDFRAEGEGGQADIFPVIENPNDPIGNSYSLARWIKLPSEPVIVPKGRSAEIPFTVTIPADAEPGGHYGAILVGTQPPQLDVAGPKLFISSFVSSLLFVKVEGEVTERARIREFRTDKTLYETPDAHFVLRFENLGNTHVRPQGIITINNMWGKKRGELLINQERGFGNVLPDSVRKFEFSWSGDASLFDIGKYSATVTLNFGDDGKQNVSAVTYFWVVPVVPVAMTLASVATFFALLVWFIRRYIRRALALERERNGVPLEVLSPPTTGQPMQAAPQKSEPPKAPAEATALITLIQPLKEGVIDLRRVSMTKRSAPIIVESVLQPTQMPALRTDEPAKGPIARGKPQMRPDAALSVVQFLQAYKLFFLFVFVLIAAAIALYLFFAKVLVPESAYEIKEVTTQLER